MITAISNSSSSQRSRQKTSYRLSNSSVYTVTAPSASGNTTITRHRRHSRSMKRKRRSKKQLHNSPRAYGRMGKTMKEIMRMKMQRRRKRKQMRMRRMRRWGRNIFIDTVAVECSSDVQEFTSETSAEFDGNPELLTEEEIAALESTFQATYNDLTFERCDGYFRTIQEVTLDVTTQNDSQRKRELHQQQRLLDDDFQLAQRSVYRTVGTCRNCPITSLGRFALFDNSLRRTLSEVYPRLDQKERDLQELDDTCICDAGFTALSFEGRRRIQTIQPNAPTEEEFLVVYNIRIEELVEEGIVVNIISVTSVTEIVEAPIPTPPLTTPSPGLLSMTPSALPTIVPSSSTVPTTAPTFLTIKQFLIQEVTPNATLFLDPSSAQSRALQALLLYFPNLNPSIPADQQDIVETYALYVFYFSTGGRNWHRATGWETSDPVCGTPDGSVPPWFGLGCNIQTNKVEEIRLEENNLSGTLPAEIGALTKLRELYLLLNMSRENRFGNLHGHIPSEIGLLINLGRWDMFGNNLSGTLPPEIFLLSNLWRLDWYGNTLSGTIPSQIALLSNLEYLSLGQNNLRGTIASEIVSLSNLGVLGLSENALGGTLPSEIGLLSNLEVLWLQENSLSGTIPEVIGSFTNLRDARFYFNSLTGVMPASICNLWSLDSLMADCVAVITCDCCTLCF